MPGQRLSQKGGIKRNGVVAETRINMLDLIARGERHVANVEKIDRVSRTGNQTGKVFPGKEWT